MRTLISALVLATFTGCFAPDSDTCGDGGAGGEAPITVAQPTTPGTATIFTCAGCTIETFDGECMASTAEHCGIDGAICQPCPGACLAGVCNPCQQEFCFAAECKIVDAENGTPCGDGDGACFAGMCSSRS